ncbi:MAG TPA: phosphoribosyltransferase family protein [Candidatus Paceibacterota bacterium]|nr:phosphoribosyltransferase family protein [Candidatus Paceibacterota bacterium]
MADRIWIWLPEQRRQAVLRYLMAHADTIMHDPSGKLPLRSGGTTDLCFNLRNARSSPAAIRYLANTYAPALSTLRSTLGITRFAEVPHALSGVAGLLSAETDIPYITIRDSRKRGRASDAVMIGDCLPGDRVAIVDDVIADGASMIPAIDAIERRGATVAAILVLIDREAGWQEAFAGRRISIPVWAGMSIAHAREALQQIEEAA